MAESYITRKSGGGGIDINGIVESYKVAAGETISAGDFVEFVNNVSPSILGTTSTYYNGSVYTFKAFVLNESKIIVFIDFLANAFAVIGTINGQSITWNSPITIVSNSFVFEYSLNVAKVGSTFVLVYRKWDSSQAASCVPITVNQNFDGINIGSTTIINTNNNGVDNITIEALNNNKAIIVYNIRYSGSTARIINVSNLTINVESAFVFDDASTSGPEYRIALLNNQKIIISYPRNAKNAVSIIGNLDENLTTITFGSRYFFSDVRVSTLNQVVLNESKVLLNYIENKSGLGFSGGSPGKSLIAKIEGNVVSFKPFSFFSKNNIRVLREFSSIKLDENKVIIFYYDATDSVYKTIMAVIEDDLISFVETKNNQLSFSSGETNILKITNEQLLLFHDNNASFFTPGNYEKLIKPSTDQIIGISKNSGLSNEIVQIYRSENIKNLINENITKSKVSSENFIESGKFVSFNALNFNKDIKITTENLNITNVQIIEIDTNKILVVGKLGSADLRLIVGTINSNDTITWGNAITQFGPYNFSGPHILKKLDTNKAVYISGAGSQLVTNVISISGSVPTVNSFSVVESSSFENYVDIGVLDNTRVVAAYKHASTLKGRILTISGNSISVGSSTTLVNNNIFHLTLVAPYSNRFIFAYRDVSNNDYGTVQSCLVSGNTFTLSSKFVFSSQYQASMRLVYLRPQTLLIVYSPIIFKYIGAARVLNIGTSGSNSISQGGEFIFSDENSSQPIIPLYLKDNLIYISHRSNQSITGMLLIKASSNYLEFSKTKKIGITVNTLEHLQHYKINDSKLLMVSPFDSDNSLSLIETGNFVSLADSFMSEGISKTNGNPGEEIEVYVK
jgi:hypothetical protein